MTILEEIRPSVERLATAVSDSLRLEVAVFDSSGSLFFCTPTYVKKKGLIVHTPFIREVIENGSILVNTPGEMPACIGCRFKQHCPSTIEILCCIHAGTAAAGVIAFTSFTKEGQRRISENTPTYLNAITELANLLGDFLSKEDPGRYSIACDMMLTASMELSGQPVLLTDAYGVILQYNRMASDLLKFCNVTSYSLWQIFSEAAVRKILEGNDLFEKDVTIGSMSAKISTKVVKKEGQINSIFIRFSGELSEPASESGFFGSIVGASPEINKIQNMIKRVAESPTPILITGETGTGKELVARAIHEQSRRKKYPFVAINCSSIPESLFESELFGYEEGAFTGAKKGGKTGKIEMAQGGTLFLDEVGEMPLTMQPKLLRILQEYELERVGSNHKVFLNIRIIAATNRDLAEMVAERTFREDLYYRINVINLKLPPLRYRKGDILPIAADYLNRLHAKIKTPLNSFSEEAKKCLLEYQWPGNVRELQNVIEYAANLCDTELLMPADLPESLAPKAGRTEDKPSFLLPAIQKQDQRLISLLERYGYTLEGKKQIASEMGISLRTLYRHLKRLQERYPNLTLA